MKPLFGMFLEKEVPEGQRERYVLACLRPGANAAVRAACAEYLAWLAHQPTEAAPHWLTGRSFPKTRPEPTEV